MNRWIAALTIALGCSSAASAMALSPPPAPECSEQRPCAAGETCVQESWCTMWGGNEYCFSSAYCEPTSCFSDADCSSGLVCVGAQAIECLAYCEEGDEDCPCPAPTPGTCEVRPPENPLDECDSDAECGLGGACVPFNGPQCECAGCPSCQPYDVCEYPTPSECRIDADCGEGEQCVTLQSRCGVPACHGPGCEEPVCPPPISVCEPVDSVLCSSDAECGGDERCNFDLATDCGSPPGCDGDTLCPAVCHNYGLCEPTGMPTWCNVDADCAGDWVCELPDPPACVEFGCEIGVSGQCVPPVLTQYCASDAECGQGRRCDYIDVIESGCACPEIWIDEDNDGVNDFVCECDAVSPQPIGICRDNEPGSSVDEPPVRFEPARPSQSFDNDQSSCSAAPGGAPAGSLAGLALLGLIGLGRRRARRAA